MENNILINTQKLESISTDFAKVSDYIRAASLIIRKEEHYSYPIVIVTQKEKINIGSLFIEKNLYQNQWTYYFTYLT